MSSTSPTGIDQKQSDLITEIQAALNKFDSQGAELLQDAFNQGGTDAIIKLQNEQQALRDSLFELMRRQLVANSAQFPNLMADTIAATKTITNSINSLAGFATILGNITTVVNLVGRVLILFGA